MSTDRIRVAVADGVAELTLDNPPMNLVTLALTRQLDAALTRLAEDTDVRALVVTGAGERAFCAGSDIKEFAAVAADVVGKKLAAENAAFSRLAAFPKPTIAAIDGVAFGGGLELAVCCDLLVAGAEARLALPEVKLGVFPGSGGTIRVPRRIGEGRAKQLMFIGEPIDAATALAWGLVDKVVPRRQALTAARALAGALAALPARALALMKEAVAVGLAHPEDEAVRRTLALSAEVFTTADCREGARAFLAKEPARWRHR
ncbi:MAG TPA: enoyl-CoA hydratase-related protein [Methylomirabilota bacterium]|jgi:enoyl-CoA hydratase/carnithine racemase